MKTIFVALFVFAAISFAASTEDDDKIFEQYLSEFNIRLPRSGSSVELKKKNFLKNRDSILKHNERFRKGEETYELAVNEYTLLDHEEFVFLKTGLLEKSGNESFGQPAPLPDQNRRGRATAPASWDWRKTSGVVRPVQNQGACGSCWAFAAIGAVEGQLKIKYNRNDKLSEQEVVECARNPWTGALLGCKGGWDFAAYNHLKDRNGVTYSSTRSYKAIDYTGCVTSTARVPNSKVVSYYDIPIDENLLKHYLFNNGPLYVTFYVSSDFYSYRGGIYSDSRRYCGSQYNNHAVLLVGYGSENGYDYWILKNSWGTGFGEGGYFRMTRK